MPHTASRLETAIPGLHATSPESLPFAPTLDIRAFLLERRDGNVLVYSTSTVADDAAAFEDLGGIARQYLNHGHEAAFGADLPGVPLFAHAADRDAIAEHRTV